LWLGEWNKFTIHPVATRFSRGISERARAALKGIDRAFGPGTGMDWGHPPGQPHGTNPAGSSVPLAPQLKSENRSSYYDKIVKAWTRARGLFTRNAKGGHPAGTNPGSQPSSQPFEKEFADYARSPSTAPTTTTRAPDRAPIHEPSRQLELPLEHGTQGDGIGVRGATSTIGYAAGALDILYQASKGDVKGAAKGTALLLALEVVPGLGEILLANDFLETGKDPHLLSISESIGQEVENKYHSRVAGAIATAEVHLFLTGQEVTSHLVPGFVKDIGRQIYEVGHKGGPGAFFSPGFITPFAVGGGYGGRLRYGGQR